MNMRAQESPKLELRLKSYEGLKLADTKSQASTNKKCYNYVERGHLTRQCPLALNRLGNTTLAESSRMTLENKSTM
jgi:hypothetical protein